MDVGPESGGPEFPAATPDEWLMLADKAFAAQRGAGGWIIVQRVDDPDLARARVQLCEDVESGATGVALVFAGAPNAFGYGLPATQEAMSLLLSDLPAGKVHLRIDAHPASRTTAEMLATLLARKRGDMSRLSLSFGIDPAAIFAGTGGLRMSIAALQASMPQSLSHFFALGAPGILLEADGRVFHNAGATEAQELGVMMASAALYLRMFAEARQPLVYAVPHIGFSLGVDQDQLLSIAKIRALRILWSKLQESFGVAPSMAAVHCETSYRMMTRLDPETNIARSTIACLGAAAGGADTISVLPHTIAHGLPDASARRVARNTQIVMAGESHVVSVSESGRVTALAAALSADAWAQFRAIESEGGVLQSLADGHIQRRIAEARTDRARLYRAGLRSVVGATAFSKGADSAASVLPTVPVETTIDTAASCERLPALRIDEMLEEPA